MSDTATVRWVIRWGKSYWHKTKAGRVWLDDPDNAHRFQHLRNARIVCHLLRGTGYGKDVKVYRLSRKARAAAEVKREPEVFQHEPGVSVPTNPVVMNHGYACIWDTAFGAWAMFHEKEEAIAYAADRSKAKGSRMYVVYRCNGEWEKVVAWDSAKDAPLAVTSDRFCAFAVDSKAHRVTKHTLPDGYTGMYCHDCLAQWLVGPVKP